MMAFRLISVIWTNPGMLLFGSLDPNFSDIWFNLQQFQYKKNNSKMPSANADHFVSVSVF